jgi:hypothetical protein
MITDRGASAIAMHAMPRLSKSAEWFDVDMQQIGL